MGSTLKYAPKQWSNESGDRPSSDTERPTRAVAAEDVFDDPSILDELAEANASLTDRSFAAPAQRSPAHLPPVDAFDFDEACRTNDFEEASRAKSLAHRLGPPGHDEADRKPSRRRNRLSDLGRRRPIVTPAAQRSSRGAFFWGFCTSLAIIIAVPAVFGFVLPRSNPPTAEVGGDFVEAAGTTPADPPEAPATEMAAVESQTNQTIAIRKQPVAAGIIAPATTAFAAPLGPPTAPDEGFRAPTARSTEAAEAAAPVIDLNRPAAEPEVANAEVASVEVAPTAAEPETAAVEIAPPVAEPETAAVEIAPPVAEPVVPAPPADETDAVPQAETAAPPSAADAGDDGLARMAQSHLSASADPSATDGFEPAPAGRPSTSEPAPSMSGEEIDRLLTRGETLLRNGNIVPARMLFLHIAAAGDARGAKAVGMTYDPEVYAQLPVTGLTPDPAQAEIWYEKAGYETAYTIDLSPPEAAAVGEDESALRERHAACERKYVSYDRNTGLYVARSGSKRPCQLP